MTGPGDVSPAVLARLRPICLGLPETYEEPAWIGVRWRVRQRTFAHVYTVDPARHHVYARAAATDQPICVLTFRSPADELAALVARGQPFFRAPWGSNVLGAVLGRRVDWAELAELLTESFCVLAPKKLVALVEHPPTAGTG